MFNDFQLERLKKRIGKVRTPITDEELMGLIERMEAAEDCANSCNIHDAATEHLYEVWRKSKGE